MGHDRGLGNEGEAAGFGVIVKGAGEVLGKGDHCGMMSRAAGKISHVKTVNDFAKENGMGLKMFK